jgi:hypothetical protein
VKVPQILHDQIEADAHEPAVIFRSVRVQGDVDATNVSGTDYPFDICGGDRRAVCKVYDFCRGKFPDRIIADIEKSFVQHWLIEPGRDKVIRINSGGRHVIDDLVDKIGVEPLVNAC